MDLHLPLILDGSTGTQLQARGFEGGMNGDLWVLEHPEVIQEFQKLYVENGSDIVYTSTFSSNRVKLEESKVFNKVSEINRRLAEITRQGVGDSALVAGDLAPTGKFITPLGDTPFEELVEIYTEQAEALESAGVDLFVVETMMTVPEVRAAILAVKSVSRKPILVTVTCNENGKMLSGSDVTAALLIAQGMGADAFGLNCSTGPDQMLIQIQRFAEFAEVPLIAKPNAGLPDFINGKAVYTCTPKEFIDYVPDFAKAGVSIFGGCCGTTEEHIKALSDAVALVEIKKPSPAHPEMLPLATEKVTALLPANTSIIPEDIIDCNSDLADILELESDKASPVTALRITSMDQLSDFEDNQLSIRKPLCLVCDDAQILEQALRLYQGRAMYEGKLSADTLAPLRARYGLVF